MLHTSDNRDNNNNNISSSSMSTPDLQYESDEYHEDAYDLR